MKLLLAFALVVTIQELGSCFPMDSDEDIFVLPKLDARTCMKEGMMCKSCTELVNCVRKPDTGELTEDGAIQCNSDFPCDEVAGGCVRDGICRNGPFICPRTDTLEPMDYPDLYDCTKYHTCTGRTDEGKQCDVTKNQAWDPRRRDCGKRQGDLCQSYPVPLCRNEGDMGFLEGTLYSFRCVLDFDAGIDMLYPRLKWNSTSA